MPDSDIKEYLLGPMNDHLKKHSDSKEYLLDPMNDRLEKPTSPLLFNEEMADWFVSRFGANFIDLKGFVTEVLQKKAVDQKKFLENSMKKYYDIFDNAWKNPNAKRILDDLLKFDSFTSTIHYDADARRNLTQDNIIALHGDVYTWNKRIVRIAYKQFTGVRQKAEELEKLKKQKPWYRFF